MSKTHLKKTSFLTSIFSIWGSQLGSQIRDSNSKNRFFSLSWANLGQLGPKRRPKTPRETQNEAKKRPKSVPRAPKRAKRAPQNLHITNPSLIRPSHNKPVTLQTGDPPFLDLKGEASKAFGPRGPQETPKRSQEAPKRAPRQDFERFWAHFSRFLGIHF